MSAATFEIPLELVSANALRRRYRKPHAYRRLRDSYGWLIKAAARDVPPATGPRRVVITRLMGPRQRPFDPDNQVAGAKPLVDELVAAGLLLDDSAPAAAITYRQERADEPGTRIELGDLEPAGLADTDAGAPDLSRLMAAWDALGADERRVLVYLGARLASGRRAYGELDLATDRRDMHHEAGEELVDAAVYLAAAVLIGQTTAKPTLSNRKDSDAVGAHGNGRGTAAAGRPPGVGYEYRDPATGLDNALSGAVEAVTIPRWPGGAGQQGRAHSASQRARAGGPGKVRSKDHDGGAT